MGISMALIENEVDPSDESSDWWKWWFITLHTL